MVATEPYEEIVGHSDVESDPYLERGAKFVDCPPPAEPPAVGGGCGAKAGRKCTFEGEEYRPGLGMVKVTKEKHHPCLVRGQVKGVA